MPNIQQIIVQREHRRSRATHRSAGAGLGCALVISLALAMMSLVLALVYTYLSHDLPSPTALPALLQPPEGLLLQPTRLYDRSGQHLLSTLENPAAAGKKYLPWDTTEREHLPPELGLTMVTVSDPSFWEHAGYTSEGLRQGAHPTLAQRLVSTFLLTDEPTGMRRALRERLLAAQVTRIYGRERVLEWYLNTAYFGHMAYGADAAARLYLGKPASQLSLAEAALLAPVAEAPALNPLDTPQVAIERQRALLARLLELGRITPQEHRAALAEKIALRQPPSTERDALAPFTELVYAQLVDQFGRERVERGGWRVATTLDYDLQLQADCALQAQLVRLKGETESDLTADGEPCLASRLLPTLTANLTPDPDDLATSAAILDPSTGQVLSLIGDPDAQASQLPHPAGTLLTPFVHLVAYTRGLSPASLAWDIPASVPDFLADEEYLPNQSHGPVRLRTALSNDYLAPTLQALEQMGAENVWRAAQQLGLESLEIPDGEMAFRLLFEDGAVKLLDFAHAFGAFSNRGVLAGQPAQAKVEENRSTGLTPVSVLKVEDGNGKPLLDWSEPETQPVLSSQLAYLITHVLSDETARWPSLGHPNPLEIGRPAAAKIGKTADGRDAWVVGYTPQRTIAVWGGYPPDQSGDDELPGLVAAVWHAIAQYSTRDLPPESWKIPPGVSTLDVCEPSGLLPTATCPETVPEVFLQGNEPTQTDTLYRKLPINRETGRLATVFTAPELVEERIYLIVPPEAEDWAKQAGLPIPPTDYDLVSAPSSTDSQVNISKPEMFSYVQGRVKIEGTASGQGFEIYRLQTGQGLYPAAWTQIGEDRHTPVEDGTLGFWDTQGLSGLYALRLLVVREDQLVDTATVQVTIDNFAPQVQMLYPATGQRLTERTGRIISFQVNASDDLELDRVEVYLDGVLLATLNGAPFAVPWQAKPGQHTVLAQAYDRAGNKQETRVSFTVLP